MTGSSISLNLGVLSRPKRILLVVWFLATLLLGGFGYYHYEAEAGAAISIWTALYHSAQLFILHAPQFSHPVNLPLEIARWSAAVFFGGTALQVARQLFPREFAVLRSFWFRNHLIVGGLGRRALQCVRCERNKPRRIRRNVVVIDRAPPADLATECAALGALVLPGDATDAALLRAAGLTRASELWALCAEDSINLETAVQAERMLAGPKTRRSRPAPLECNVHLSDIDLRVELQRWMGPPARGAPVSLRFFDLYDFEARRVLRDDLPLDHEGIPPGESRRPHLVILGLGRMGRSIAVRAAKLGHFANAVADPGRRLRISAIDRAGARGESALLFRYPGFREVCDLEVHTLDIESPEARARIEEWCADPASLTSLAVCFDDAARAVEVALRLLPALRPEAVRVAVRIAHREGLGSVVERVWDPARPGGTRARVLTFGRLDEGCCDEALDGSRFDRLAGAIHDDFVRHRLEEGSRAPTDRSLAPWPELDEDLRESNRQQADHIVVKLRTVGCDLVARDDPRPPLERFADGEAELLARMEHQRWNAERLLAGWSRGPKDVDRKTSPYLCAWEELPEPVRDYDRDAVRAIPGLVAGVGMKVVRR